MDGLSSIICIYFPHETTILQKFHRKRTNDSVDSWALHGPATLTHGVSWHPMTKVVPSGHLQVVQQEILCRAQAWRSLKRGLASLVRHDVAAAAAAAGDPDEGKVHRLAEVSWRLRMMGCMPGALELLVGGFRTFFVVNSQFDGTERDTMRSI